MTMHPIEEIQKRLAAHHPEVSFTATENSITISPPTPDGFVVEFERLTAGFIVRFDGWHEHFESAERALDCLAFGFSGKARIAVTYRGRIPVKWVLEYCETDEWRADSEVGHFFVPFWLRRKVVYRQNPNRLVLRQ